MSKLRDTFLIKEAQAGPLVAEQARALRLVQASFSLAMAALAKGDKNLAASEIRNASTKFDRMMMALAQEVLQ